jgi:ABC transport system ATP-binding/permease protein
MATTTLGLAVSASVDSNDKAIAMVPILLIPQVVLSNAIVAMKATLESQIPKAQDAVGAPIVSLAGAYWSDLGMVIGLDWHFWQALCLGSS